jgi:hypothetical protein
MDPLLTLDDDLLTGTIVDRPNRFVVRVRFEDAPERVFLGDPGALEGTVESGNEILCSPVDDPDRATDYDGIAVYVDDVYVSVRPTFANDLFERALARDAIPAFTGYTCQKREPALPDHGRTDFRLETPDGDTAYVEIKSCTTSTTASPSSRTDRPSVVGAISGVSKRSAKTAARRTSCSSYNDLTSTASGPIEMSIRSSPNYSLACGKPEWAYTRSPLRSTRLTTRSGTTTCPSTSTNWQRA